MKIVKRFSSDESGYNVAKEAFQNRWDASIGVPDIETWMLADASTPSPNLRASELFLQLAIATQYPGKNLVSFMGYGGTLGEYRHLWPAGDAVDDSQWRDFYDPYMRNIAKVSGNFAPAALLGPVHLKRAELLENLGIFLGIAKVGLVLPLEESFNVPLVDLSWYGGNALGKVPCPDCSNQRSEVIYHPVRLSNGAYVLCRNEHATNEVGCKGAKAWRERQAWQTPIAELVKLIGLRLSGKAVYQLIWSASSVQNSALLVRDYSSSRGTVESIVANYPTSQVSVTTALNIKRNGVDATGYDLSRAFSINPSSWSDLLHSFPVFSQGEIWDINLD